MLNNYSLKESNRLTVAKKTNKAQKGYTTQNRINLSTQYIQEPIYLKKLIKRKVTLDN